MDTSSSGVAQTQQAPFPSDTAPEASALATGGTRTYELDLARPLDPTSFPNPPRDKKSAPPTTIPNVAHLLASYGITVRYNVIKKRLLVTMPGHAGVSENFDNTALTQVLSLVTLNGMSTSGIPAIVSALGDRNAYNPAAEWITGRPWDGVDRFREFTETLTERDDFPGVLKVLLLKKFLLSIVAAALMPSGFSARGVLTLQGRQSMGKTRWTRSLVPDPALCRELVKLDQHMDPSSKDSLLEAVGYLIVEIGELDSSFRRDVARLKGFLTRDQDDVRPPYAAAISRYPRRTVFCATVNDSNFLVDTTGNTRFWTIPVVAVTYEHGIDMQQLFAQVATWFYKGQQWWLTREEEELLELHNKNHRSVSAIKERILDELDLDRAKDPNLPARTAMEVLHAVGIKNPSNAQCKECGSVLRETLGDPKRINGRDKWRVPLRDDFQYVGG